MHVVRLDRVRKPGTPVMSFQVEVSAYEAEDARHCQILMHAGVTAKN
jgi:hypothetical protein